MSLSIGIIGTSWWVDSMYLPALQSVATVTAIAGRDPDRARARAEQWNIPAVYTDWQLMLDKEQLDAVIVAAANPVHYPATHTCLEKGLAVACEKPLAATYLEARELVELARRREITTMVPFTYAYMPAFVYLERLIREGWIGEIRHLSLRYHNGYGLDGKYRWKLDQAHNPAGALSDIGSHFIYLANRLAGPFSWVQADLARLSPVPPKPDGQSYHPAPDSARLIFGLAQGGHGSLESTVVSWEGPPMGQRHRIEVWGSEGSVSLDCDWAHKQEVWGARVEEGSVRRLEIPAEIWGDLRRDWVHDTYRDVFRKTDAMTRGWVKAVEAGEPYKPDLTAGAEVQAVLEAALLASERKQRVEMDEILGNQKAL